MALQSVSPAFLIRNLGIYQYAKTSFNKKGKMPLEMPYFEGFEIGRIIEIGNKKMTEFVRVHPALVDNFRWLKPVLPVAPGFEYRFINSAPEHLSG
jgi:hypothetical protein